MVFTKTFLNFANMKKYLSVIVTGMAILITMIAVDIHHHHYGEMMYVVAADCCNGQDEDQHKEDQQPETADHSLHYLAASFVKVVMDQDSNADSHFLHFMAALTAVELPDIFNDYHTIGKQLAFSTPPRYHLTWIVQSLGFRAPPALVF